MNSCRPTDMAKSSRTHQLLPRRLGEQRLRALVKLQTTEAAADSIINEFCRAFHIKGQKAAPLLVCAVASKIERALQNYLLLPLFVKKFEIRRRTFVYIIYRRLKRAALWW